MSRKNVQRKQRQPRPHGKPSPDRLARALAAGLEHHQAGRIVQAEQSYRDILAQDSRYHDAWHLLGLIAQQQGRLDEAVRHISHAISLRADVAVYHYNLAVVSRDSGNHAAACEHFAIASRLDPADLDAPLCRAELLRTLGDNESAVPLYFDILGRDPGCSDARRGLAIILNTYTFLAYDPQYDALLTDLLTGGGIEGQLLARPAASLLERKYLVDTLNLAQATDVVSVCSRLGVDRLFTGYLAEAINISPAMERFLIRLRAALLVTYAEDAMNVAAIPVAQALAYQAINNGYLLPVAAPEEAELDRIKTLIESRIINATSERQFATWLLLLAMYRPLYPSPLAEPLAALPRDCWSPDMQALMSAMLYEPMAEAALHDQIPRIDGSGDRVSGAVRAMYEESPYPRWKRMREHTLTAYDAKFASNYPWVRDCAYLAGPFEILVAGSGTGRHPIEVAKANPAANVTALDLSVASLAYGARMARELNIGNVHFVQGDILDIGSLDRQFDVIESVGVLHHMAEPLRGWRILVDCLKPGGLMRIGLYSRLARQSVNVCRRYIEERGLKPDPNGMNVLRNAIINGEFGPALRDDVVKWSDFFYTNGVRDLLFHVMEHQYDLDQIDEILHSLGLSFISFEPLTRYMQELFRQAYPAAPDFKKLECWSVLEAGHTDIFRGMYQFWTQKTRAG